MNWEGLTIDGDRLLSYGISYFFSVAQFHYYNNIIITKNWVGLTIDTDIIIWLYHIVE